MDSGSAGQGQFEVYGRGLRPAMVLLLLSMMMYGLSFYLKSQCLRIQLGHSPDSAAVLAPERATLAGGCFSTSRMRLTRMPTPASRRAVWQAAASARQQMSQERRASRANFLLLSFFVHLSVAAIA